MRNPVTSNSIVIHFATILGLSLLFSSCSNGTSGKRSSMSTSKSELDYPVDVRHAKCFAVENLDNAKRIYLLSSESRDTLSRYLLLPKDGVVDSLLIRPDDDVVVRVPVERAVMLSSTFVGGLIELDSRDVLIGGSDIKRYYDAELLERANEGQLSEVGQAMAVNYERVIALRPELVMHDYLAPGDKLPDFKKLGIASVQNIDWQEESLLGRAEWIKFIGLMIGKTREADSLFNRIEANYSKALSEVAARTATVKQKPKALFGQDFKGVWYLPSEQSYVAQMLLEAGASFKGSSSNQRSQPLSIEQVFATQHDADFWFAWNSNRIENLKGFLEQNQMYKQFKAFRNGQVFVNDKCSNTNGGNDYWERAPYHPDRLLLDLKGIFYPDSINNAQTAYYWRQLK